MCSQRTPEWLRSPKLKTWFPGPSTKRKRTRLSGEQRQLRTASLRTMQMKIEKNVPIKHGMHMLNEMTLTLNTRTMIINGTQTQK
jgi:hypothetical protein